MALSLACGEIVDRQLLSADGRKTCHILCDSEARALLCSWEASVRSMCTFSHLNNARTQDFGLRIAKHSQQSTFCDPTDVSALARRSLVRDLRSTDYLHEAECCLFRVM